MIQDLQKLDEHGELQACVKQLLEHPERRMRAAAAQRLGELSHPAAAEALEYATRREQDVFVVILIERALLAIIERTTGANLAACG